MRELVLHYDLSNLVEQDFVASFFDVAMPGHPIHHSSESDSKTCFR